MATSRHPPRLRKKTLVQNRRTVISTGVIRRVKTRPATTPRNVGFAIRTKNSPRMASSIADSPNNVNANVQGGSRSMLGRAAIYSALIIDSADPFG